MFNIDRFDVPVEHIIIFSLLNSQVFVCLSIYFWLATQNRISWFIAFILQHILLKILWMHVPFPINYIVQYTVQTKNPIETNLPTYVYN